MALIHWKQIDGDLSGSRVLTGSLVVSGTISADEFIGIDPTAIFTGSISASVSPTGNVFTIKSRHIYEVRVKKQQKKAIRKKYKHIRSLGVCLKLQNNR